MTLNAENYKSGFLIDEELMGAVTEVPAAENGLQNEYAAYVLRHTTGEYLGYEKFARLEDALEKMNSIQRNWAFESTKTCGDGKCRKVGGNCAGDRCTTCSCA